MYQPTIDAALEFIKGFKVQFHSQAAIDTIAAALAASPAAPHLTTAFEAVIAHADQIFTSPVMRRDCVFLLHCAVAFLQTQPKA